MKRLVLTSVALLIGGLLCGGITATAQVCEPVTIMQLNETSMLATGNFGVLISMQPGRYKITVDSDDPALIVRVTADPCISPLIYHEGRSKRFSVDNPGCVWITVIGAPGSTCSVTVED